MREGDEGLERVDEPTMLYDAVRVSGHEPTW